MHMVQIGNAFINLEQVTMIDANYHWNESIYQNGEVVSVHNEGVLIRFAGGGERVIRGIEDGARFIEYVAGMSAFIGEVAE